MRVAAIVFVLVAIAPAIARAETAYITDKLHVSLREGQGSETPAVKSIVTGTEVEVLQRLNGFTLVREPGGAEGWIADRYLVATAPASAAADASTAQLARLRTDLEQAKKQLAVAQTSARKEAARARALEQKLNSMESAQAAVTATGAREEAETPAQADEVVADGFRFHWLWFLVAFAMLVTGFVSGIVWLREVNRKKMGGMYLRI